MIYRLWEKTPPDLAGEDESKHWYGIVQFIEQYSGLLSWNFPTTNYFWKLEDNSRKSAGRFWTATFLHIRSTRTSSTWQHTNMPGTQYQHYTLTIQQQQCRRPLWRILSGNQDRTRAFPCRIWWWVIFCKFPSQVRSVWMPPMLYIAVWSSAEGNVGIAFLAYSYVARSS